MCKPKSISLSRGTGSCYFNQAIIQSIVNWALFMITISRLLHLRFYLHLLFKVYTNCNHVSIVFQIPPTSKPVPFTKCRFLIPRNGNYFVLCRCRRNTDTHTHVFSAYGKVLLWLHAQLPILSFLHPNLWNKISFHRFCLEQISVMRFQIVFLDKSQFNTIEAFVITWVVSWSLQLCW